MSNKIDEKRLNGMIAFVVSQTNYNDEVAKRLLKENDYNSMKVIRLYLNGGEIKKKEVSKNNSVNKMMMDEYRHFLDNVNREYNNRKKINELYKRFVDNSNYKQSKRISQNNKVEYNEKEVDVEEID
mgnify:CR=1 FL=1|tara:strand:+ start:694 stop:1074 length:381 start_codon:yes stop_codon:yes gene_type:complete